MTQVAVSSSRTNARPVAIIAFAACCAAPSPALAQMRYRWIVDMEPIAIHEDSDGDSRTHVATATASIGIPSEGDGHWIPYAGAGIGFFSLQTRVGVLWLAGGLEQRGIVARIEARPQFVNFYCGEPGVFGNVGLGYRWPLESGMSLYPGPGVYIMPSVEVGPAWVRRGCPRIAGVPLEGHLFYGGAGAIGLDF